MVFSPGWPLRPEYATHPRVRDPPSVFLERSPRRRYHPRWRWVGIAPPKNTPDPPPSPAGCRRVAEQRGRPMTKADQIQPSYHAIMILKERLPRAARNRFEAAGIKAEQQLAHYLKRSFGDAKDVFVLNDLRVLRSGEVAQIDHLVIHRSGMVIIESKSVSTEIHVNRQHEFTRTFRGKRHGMASPIEQAKRQADLIRRLLEDHAESLLPKSLGLLQQRFGSFPVEILIAISDQGIIKHQGQRPSELLKADAITERLKSIVTRHARARGITGMLRQALADDKKAFDGFGDFNLKPDEVERLAGFLLERHEEQRSNARAHSEDSLAASSDHPQAPRSKPPPAPRPPTRKPPPRPPH